MSNDMPTSTIKEQSLTDTPTNSDSTIMDDTVVLMDSNALMGGPTVNLDELFTYIPRKS